MRTLRAVAGLPIVTAILPVLIALSRAPSEIHGAQPQPPPTAVRFVPVEAPLFAGEERPAPFGWGGSSVYLAGGDDSPELIYQTQGVVAGLAWSVDGRTVVARLNSESSDGTGIAGVGLLNPTDRAETVDLLFAVGNAYPSPDGARVALNVWFPSTALSPPPPGTPVERGIYLVERDGSATRLDGLGGAFALPQSILWTPDGNAFLMAAGRRPFGPATALYLVPRGGGDATVVVPDLGNSFGDYQFAWSPDGTRLAIVVDDRVLQVFNRETGDRRMLAMLDAQPTWTPSWSADGALVLLQTQQQVELFEEASGQRITSMRPPTGVIAAALSPDGRFLAVGDRGGPDFRSVVCGAGQQNQTWLYDRRTGETTVFRPCGNGYIEDLGWLGDGRHLLLRDRGCESCDDQFRVIVADVEAGPLEGAILTRGREPHARGYVAERGNRVLVVGTRLQIFDTHRPLGPAVTLSGPERCAFGPAAWAPDGLRVVYAVVCFEPRASDARLLP